MFSEDQPVIDNDSHTSEHDEEHIPAEIGSEGARIIMMEGMEVCVDCTIHRIMGLTNKKKAKPVQTYAGGRAAMVRCP